MSVACGLGLKCRATVGGFGLICRATAGLGLKGWVTVGGFGLRCRATVGGGLKGGGAPDNSDATHPQVQCASRFNTRNIGFI